MYIYIYIIFCPQIINNSVFTMEPKLLLKSVNIYIYTFMHLADIFMQSDLNCIQGF